ncbi:MAG TPA: hypothetical protein VFK52_08140 [Nocardioidaceae bacterium]|nr:hypothetical protein [Nocardioidaceae bacterium]
MNTSFRIAAAGAVLALVGSGTPADALPSYTTAPSSWSNPNLEGQPAIVDLRVSEHRRFDRVVIDVDGRRPSYQVRYVSQLTYDGSGEPVPLKGRKKLVIRLEPARAHGPKGGNLYDGPRLQQYDFPMLRGVAFLGDFEGVVSFGLTARARNGYRVFTLTDPSRLVIDLKH